MTLHVLSLCAAFMVPVGSIAREIWREEMRDATARDIARCTTANLPPERRDLKPLDWPRRQTPTDLPARLGFVVAPDGAGRHRAADVDLTTTGQFWAIVDNFECAHCASPEDGEPAHVGCPGCSCPCTLEAVRVGA